MVYLVKQRTRVHGVIVKQRIPIHGVMLS